jgi:TRAP-type C4-dicarboxylate transport system permease small subunit
MIESIKAQLIYFGAEIRDTNLPNIRATSENLRDVLQIAIAIVAALSILFIMIGGLRYIMSDGDPQAAGQAKSTIIYALIGLLIAVAAQAIVAFVLKKV